MILERFHVNPDVKLKSSIIMLTFIIWIIGVVLTIKAAMEIWKLNVDSIKKLVVIVILVLTSWLGLAVYYLLAKDKLATWLK